MILNNWNIEEMTGYKPITTFYLDFSIADNFGIKAIKETYNKAFKGWRDNYKYLTELVMVLNWKSWEHYEKDYEKCKLYCELFEKLNDYCYKNLKGEELSYFFETTD